MPDDLLARHRLAAQRLVPETAASSPEEAARAVLGIQAQDVRAATLAIRSRVPGADREAVLGSSELVRTWTVRGTLHLLAADDLPLLHALTASRNGAVYDRLMEQRGNVELARRIRPDLLAILAADGPATKAELLRRLGERGHPPLDRSSSNVLMPWISASGCIVGLPDGRFRVTDPPPELDPDEALATLGRRYLAGYAPAGARDLAKWSGLSLATARRALDAFGPHDSLGDDLLAPSGALDADPPPAPAARLLAPFDTTMLGWRTREPLVPARHDRQVLPGGGIVRGVLLNRGRAAATWRLDGSGRSRLLALEPFGRAPARAALAAEAADVGRFLGLEVRLPS